MNIRLLPIAGIAGLLSIALAGSAVAGGGFPPPPGTYRTTDTMAFAQLTGPSTTVCFPGKGCGPGPSDVAFVNVDRGLHTFKPKSGPRLVQQSGTMLTLDVFTLNGPSASGCWMIADSAFVVAGDLSAASLSATVPAASNCPGAPVALSASSVVSGKVGGGGSGTGTGAPITINASWTYRGVVSHSRDDASLSCGSFNQKVRLDSDNASATAQGQVSLVTEIMTSDFASIQQSSGNQVVKGVPPDACF